MTQSAFSPASVWRDDASDDPDALRQIDMDWPNRACSRIVKMADIDWHVQRGGSGQRVLLVHGTGSSAHSWGDVFAGLASDHDVLAVDLPGHGYSTPLASGSMSLTAISSALAALLESIEFRPNIIVGHSAGAAIGLSLAQQEIGAAARIVGINAALQPFGGMFAALFSPLAKSIAMLPLVPSLIARRARDLNSVRRMLESTGSKLADTQVQRYQRLLRNDRHVAATLRMMADWDLRMMIDAIAPIAPRLHLIAAQADTAVSPTQSLGLQARYPEVSVVELAGVGHLAHEERPDLIRQQIAVVARTESIDGR